MAWCPNCKNEYKDEIKFCSDCKVALVNSLEPEQKMQLITGEIDLLTKYFKFLKFNHLESAELIEDEAKASAEILVLENEYDKALKIVNVLIQEENDDEEDPEEAELSEEELNKSPEKISTGSFQKSSDKAKEYRSTAIMLMILGIAGIIVILLNLFSVINLPLNLISSLTMCALFLMFFVFGILSYQSSIRIMKSVEEENKTEIEIERVISEKLTKDVIITEFPHENEEEILYFKRMDYMRKIIFAELEHVNPDQVEEKLEHLYQEYFNEN